jgi:hypothetical protein
MCKIESLGPGHIGPPQREADHLSAGGFRPLKRLHSDRAIQPDALSIQVIILDNENG